MTTDRELRAVPGGGRGAHRALADPEVELHLERATLCGLLLDPTQLAGVREIIGRADFCHPIHRMIYGGLERTAASDPKDVSLCALADELDRAGELANVGGYAALSAIADEGATGAQVLAHARRVRLHALEREERRLAERAASGDTDVRASMAEIGQQIEALAAEAAPASDPLAERFDDVSIGYVFDGPPAARSFLLPDFLPEAETGLFVGRGSVGKGFVQVALALSLALGERFGTFEPARRRGVLLVSLEEGPDEFHRRLWASLRLRLGVEDADFRDRLEALRAELLPRLGFVSLRGLPGVTFETVREPLLRAAEDVEDLGLIALDPVGRFVPHGVEINSQSGGAVVVGALDAIREDAGAFALGIYHTNKLAIRDGGELRPGASSGSLQLEDLARWVLNGKSLEGEELARYALSPGRYLQLALSKSNYTSALADPLVFRRREGGALEYAAASAPEATADAAALAALLRVGAWATRDAWEAAADADEGLSRDRCRAARSRLKKAGRIEVVRLREGQVFRDLFAPASELRPECWPAPPGTLAELSR